jgi:hypothetical protein
MALTANFWERHGPAGFRSLDWPRLWRILVQSKVRPALVIVGHDASEVATQAAFRPDDHMIEASRRIVPITRSM